MCVPDARCHTYIIHTQAPHTPCICEALNGNDCDRQKYFYCFLWRERALLKAFVAYIVRWHCFRQHLNVIDIFNDGYFSWFSGASHDMTLSYHASHTEFLEWMRLWGGQFDKRNSLTTFWGNTEKKWTKPICHCNLKCEGLHMCELTQARSSFAGS